MHVEAINVYAVNCGWLGQKGPAVPRSLAIGTVCLHWHRLWFPKE